MVVYVGVRLLLFMLFGEGGAYGFGTARVYIDPTSSLPVSLPLLLPSSSSLFVVIVVAVVIIVVVCIDAAIVVVVVDGSMSYCPSMLLDVICQATEVVQCPLLGRRKIPVLMQFEIVHAV